VLTPAAWWEEAIGGVGAETRAALEAAAAALESAGCPRGVWALALKEYLERTPLPTDQWLDYAAQFEQLAQQLEARRTLSTSFRVPQSMKSRPLPHRSPASRP
jgi:hypothetical protein